MSHSLRPVFACIFDWLKTGHVRVMFFCSCTCPMPVSVYMLFCVNCVCLARFEHHQLECK